MANLTYTVFGQNGPRLLLVAATSKTLTVSSIGITFLLLISMLVGTSECLRDIFLKRAIIYQQTCTQEKGLLTRCKSVT